MSRLVLKTAHGPKKVGDKFICMCGLSKNQPFCDTSHKKTLNEDDEKLYYYENGKQEEVDKLENEADDFCCCGECQCEDEGQDKTDCCGGGHCGGECGCNEEEISE